MIGRRVLGFVIASLAFANVLVTAGAIRAEGFYAAEQHEIGEHPIANAAADFDGDGRTDLIVAFEGAAGSAPGARLLLGGGTPPNALSPTGPVFTLADPPVDVVADDLDGDGDADFAVLTDTGSGGLLRIWHGDGNGGFLTGPTAATGAATPIRATAANFDGDTQADLAVVHQDAAGTLAILLGDGSGGYPPGLTSALAAGDLPWDVTAADLDSDGDLDLAVVDDANGPAGTIQGFVNDGSGGFVAGVAIPVADDPRAIAADDLSGDGQTDLIVVHRTPTTSNSGGYSLLHYLRRTAPGSFVLHAEEKTGQCPIDVAILDLDDDGDRDIALAHSNGQGCGWSEGQGSTFLLDTADAGDPTDDLLVAGSTFTVGHDARELAVGLFDGDGDRDLAITNRGRLSNLGIDISATMATIVNLRRRVNPSGVTIAFDDIVPLLGASAASLHLEADPGGVAAVGDFDRDGWADLFLSHRFGTDILINQAQPAAFGSGGDPFEAFDDTVTGIAGPRSASAAVVADFNNDAWPDVYVAASGIGPIDCDCIPPAQFVPGTHDPNDVCRVIPTANLGKLTNRLYLNDGDQDGTPGWDRTFTEVTVGVDDVRSTPLAGAPGFSEVTRGSTTTTVAGDFDRNGWIDLYSANFFNNGCGGGSNAKHGLENGLYLNQGVSGAGVLLPFADATATAGALGTLTTGDPDLSQGGSALAAFAADIDHDGWLDLYVANDNDLPDGSPLYINRGNDSVGAWRGFKEKAVAFGIEDRTPAGMGADIVDWNGDGHLELATTDGVGPQAGNIGCALFVQKPGLFALDQPSPGPSPSSSSVSAKMVIQQPPKIDLDPVDFPNPIGSAFGWHVGAEDLDLDGDEDIHLNSTAWVMDMLFRNDGTDSAGNPILASVGGRALGHRGDARAAAFADFDRDGRVDIFQINPAGPSDPWLPSSLFMNRSIPQRNWLHVRVLAKVPPTSGAPASVRRDGIGARVTVKADVDGVAGKETMVRVIQAGEGNSGSTGEATARFGLGNATSYDITVRWPDGTTTSRSGMTVINTRFTARQP